MIKVFFDGNCPICSREIKVYKKLDKKGEISWYDISNDEKALSIIKKTKKECLKSIFE